MRLEALPRRLGLDREPAERRLAARVVLAVLLVYVLGFAAFYPRVLTNDDEAIYVDQARLLAEGRITVPKLDPVSGELREYRDDYYPVGTALWMAPFVAASGWQGAFLVPLLGLVLSVLILVRWLGEEGRSPLFALLLLGFPAALVMGRVAMSDVPNLAVVTLALWLFWRSRGASPGQWLASGFLAGASLMFRDTNAVLFAPLYLGTVLRRERHWWALAAGGVGGVALKLLSAQLAFGDPFYLRSEYVPELHSLGVRLAVHLLALLVAVPGGLLVALAYRGPRAPELRASILLFLFFFVLQKHTTYASELSRRLILDWRYLLAVLPLVIFGMAEALPRLWSALVERMAAPRREALARLAGTLVVVWIAGVAAAALLTHWSFDRWSRSQAEIRDAIHEHTGDGSVLITNKLTTRKFLRNLEREYLYVDRDGLSPQEAGALLERYGEIFLVFLDRSDTSHRVLDADQNAAFMGALDPAPEIVVDRWVSASEHLRIWRMSGRPRGG